MKRIPIGIENFKEIVTEDFYYVDKTKFIDELIYDGSQVKLFTRPRRFGKTLNMSMLKYFFDIRNNEENRKLFNGLDIENSKYIDEQGKYPTILISLKGIKGNTWQENLAQLKILIRELYNDYLPAYNVSVAPKCSFNIIGRRSSLISNCFHYFSRKT